MRKFVQLHTLLDRYLILSVASANSMSFFFSAQSMEEPQLSKQGSQGWVEDPRLAGRPPHEHDLMRKYSDAPMLFKAHAESFHIHEEEIDREERIGEGQVGTVCKGRFRGSAVAIKDLKNGTFHALLVLSCEKSTNNMRTQTLLPRTRSFSLCRG